MKLVFPHGEHKDFELIGDEFTIGSSDESVIQIDAVGLKPVHATLAKDGNNYVLKTSSASSMASVNGRLVKSYKEVREGDLMIISQVHCKLEADNKEVEDDNRTRIRMALPQFILRGVSGIYFGKTFPLRGKTSLGRHSDNDIFVNVDGISRKHAVISVVADGLQIEDMDSANGTFVNGEKVTKQKLNIGDEIKLDNIRFLIQSPGMQMEKEVANSTQYKDKSQNSNKTQVNRDVDSSSGVGKWVFVGLVLVAAAVAGAWYMGLLDKFIK
jgi:pSer/pThr/pTyr-binding forkhead associated (FHA) protein